MGPLGAAPWHPERFCFIATALSASTGVTAPDKVDRLEARTAFRAPEPAVVAGSGAQGEAAVAAVSDAQREAAAEASGARQAVGPVAVARPLVASVESAGTAAVRFWIRATMVSAAALERRVVSAAK